MPGESPDSNIQSMQRLIANILSQTEFPDAIQPLSNDSPIVTVARKNGVLPLLQHAISKRHLWYLFPEDIKHQMTHHALASMAFDMAIEHELQAVLRLFIEHRISFIILKGTALAYTEYEESHHRDRCDTDLLFKDSDHADNASRLLEERGYLRSTTLTGDYVGYQFTCQKHIKKNLPMTFDMHLKINDHIFYANLFSYDDLMQNSRALAKLDIETNVYGLKPVYALIHACIHLVGHLGRANLRLIWLYDIYLLTSRFQQPDWDELTDICLDKGIAGSLMASLNNTEKYFPVPIPASNRLKLEQSADKEALKPQGKTSRWQHYYISLKSIPTLRGKVKMILEHLLPRPAYIMHKYQTSNHWLLPYLYIHRIFSGFKKYL